MNAARWLPADVCAALVEEAVREALTPRYLKGTVEETVIVARRKVAELLDELDRAEDGPDPAIPPS